MRHIISLKANRAHMRVGPSFEDGVEWVYLAQSLPLEIIEEYGNWRKVRDCHGIFGWMHRLLLSSRRTAVVGPWLKDTVPLRTPMRKNGTIQARLEPRVRIQLLSCSLSCGFVEKSSLWGVYPKEVFERGRDECCLHLQLGYHAAGIFGKIAKLAPHGLLDLDRNSGLSGEEVHGIYRRLDRIMAPRTGGTFAAQ
ncbi:SH3 domain-containing protein (plasmid) [Rhizobium sp. YTUHZ045]|uniref:SH3 domain-containing protein n=1 Tax=Rhizobium sp. YTUHZ045 TaxID=2962888 RepID=UPI003DA83F04